MPSLLSVEGGGTVVCRAHNHSDEAATVHPGLNNLVIIRDEGKSDGQ